MANKDKGKKEPKKAKKGSKPMPFMPKTGKC